MAMLAGTVPLSIDKRARRAGGRKRPLSHGLIGLLGGGQGVTLLPYSASIDRGLGAVDRSGDGYGALAPTATSIQSLTSEIDWDRFAGGSTKKDGNS
jgi:hypothetical protein